MQLPEEILDMIMGHVLDMDSSELTIQKKHARQSNNERRNKPGLQTLASLRLTNKTFNRIASPWLFRQVDIRLTGSYTRPPVWRLQQIANSPHARHVRQVDLGFARSIRGDGRQRWSQASMPPPYLDDGGSVERGAYEAALAECLPSCLAKFSNLKALGLDDPSSPLKDLDDANSALCRIVADSLRQVPGLDREELRLELPRTWYLDAIEPRLNVPNSMRLRHVFHRLRHLGALVLRHRTRQPDGSNLQQIMELPTLPLADWAVNVKALEIGSVNESRLPRFTFSPSPLRLESLFLRRVRFSDRALLHLLQQCRHSIQRIFFAECRLETGTWREAFVWMRDLPRLVDLGIDEASFRSDSDGHDRALLGSQNSVYSCGMTASGGPCYPRTPNVHALWLLRSQGYYQAPGNIPEPSSISSLPEGIPGGTIQASSS
ncbi:hypothetical protein BO70DRAFT_430123 [Aspergillus heteromorphus CBS 117.55]|uniref:Uncharacterized protein n=1 Tax=Aspergillus heteromorphus CBS 117.55 TaxID=1448321 RepID=A0A317VWP1_9EURO|nr:uncharacterized protein BO70DRAFT_430123 [Aspergillus heteromorphus CBS 117.55]PWY78195.1 hypothetical protein BO70DRAFT_430123 [Aspergillus heteromorphus CBS 117.55]